MEEEFLRDSRLKSSSMNVADAPVSVWKTKSVLSKPWKCIYVSEANKHLCFQLKASCVAS